MSHIVIQGGRRLEGTLTVQGAKNSVLPILAATILHPGRTTLRGCPRLSDVEASIRILRHLGCKAEWEGEELTVDASTLDRWDIPDHLMREMRSSVVFLGAILARMGWAELSHPGGCELGPRPIDLHLAALRQLGAQLREESGCLQCSAQCMEGREIVLSMPSVGATENAMLAACGCQGKTAADAADDGQTNLQWEADSELSADPEAEGLPGGEAGTEWDYQMELEQQEVPDGWKKKSDAAPTEKQDAPDEAGYTFRNQDLLESHYQKHGVDMGFSSAEEYEEAACAVINNPDALHKLEAEDGDDVYYVEATNEFVIVSTDGYIRTYFYPDAGIDYYDRQ